MVEHQHKNLIIIDSESDDHTEESSSFLELTSKSENIDSKIIDNEQG